MTVRPIAYLRWAKNRPPVRFDLSTSGVPEAGPEDFGAAPEDLHPALRHDPPDEHLRDLIARRYGVPPEHVLPLPAASGANCLAMAALWHRGDRVLVETPHYEPLLRVAEWLGLRVDMLPRAPERDYVPDLHAIADALRRGVRGVILTNLHNPTGRAIPFDFFPTLGAALQRHDGWALIDEVYLDFARICGNSQGTRSAASLHERIVVSGSLTKVYGLGGLRLGWLLGPPHVLEAVAHILDYFTVVNPVPSMRLALRAMLNLERLEQRTRTLWSAGRSVLDAWLQRCPHLRSAGNDGAVFEWIALPEGIDADTLAAHLRRRYDTLVVPGSFFDAPGFLRVGFALPPDDLAEGLDRLARAVDDLRR